MIDGQHHVALVMGDVERRARRARARALGVPDRRRVRLAALRLRRAAERALQLIADGGHAACCVYLRQEGRGIGLLNKLRAYELQEQGMDTVDANLALGLASTRATTASARRSCATWGCPRIRIMTNNPKKIVGLEGYGLVVTEQVPIVAEPNQVNESYLRTKAERMGHTITHQGRRLDPPDGVPAPFTEGPFGP